MCKAEFPEVSFACVVDFVKKIKEGENPLALIEQGLWLSGSIVATFQVKPGVLVVSLSEDHDMNVQRLTSMLKSYLPENDAVALALPWAQILAIVLKLIELIGKQN